MPKRCLTEQDLCMIDEWVAAKCVRNFAKSDAIRVDLRFKGIDGHAYAKFAKKMAFRRSDARPKRARKCDLGFDLGGVLEQWVTAKRSGDIDVADAAFSKLAVHGVNPYEVWPDVVEPWKQELAFLLEGHTSEGEEELADNDCEYELWEPELLEDASSAGDNQVDDDVGTLAEVLVERPSEAEFVAAKGMAHTFYMIEATPKIQAQPPQVVNFAPELLSKAPSSLQTCSSLLTFLQKKMSAPMLAAPEPKSPSELQDKLKGHADRVARCAILQSLEGWDCRAKRVLDVCSYAATTKGNDMLDNMRRHVEAERVEIVKELDNHGVKETLAELTYDRQKWAEASARREWLVWCAQLLSARKSTGSDESPGEEENKENNAVPRATEKLKSTPVDMLHIFDSLLNGRAPQEFM